MSTQPLRDAVPDARRREADDPGLDEERRLLEGLRRRDERIYRVFIRTHHEAMVRVAQTYVGSRAVAEEVAQETWAAMFRGLAGFEGRSTVRSWLFSILVRRARTVGARERRTAPFSQLIEETDHGAEDAFEGFFHPDGHAQAGSWAVPPRPWRNDPEAHLLNSETRTWLARAIEELPETQRLVMTLRDVEGWKTSEVAIALDRTSNWVRVTLHRARFKVRSRLEVQLGVKE